MPDEKPDLGDRYEPVAHLAAGGFGEVWRAFDRTLGRDVAVKILDRERVDVQEVVREARMMAKVKDPRVAGIFDVDGKRGIIVMEYVPGPSLAGILEQKKQLSQGETRSLLNEICCGVGAIHSAGLVHRDLKPANIVVDSWAEGSDQVKIKIVDFGIARVEAHESETLTQTVVWTPAYAAPEQAHPAKPSVAMDVYALGVIGREMVGLVRPPIESTSLRAVFAKATAHEPSDRYRTAAEFSNAVNMALATPSRKCPVCGKVHHAAGAFPEGDVCDTCGAPICLLCWETRVRRCPSHQEAELPGGKKKEDGASIVQDRRGLVTVPVRSDHLNAELCCTFRDGFIDQITSHRTGLQVGNATYKLGGEPNPPELNRKFGASMVYSFKSGLSRSSILRLYG